jgi:hypothetical protein
LRLRWKQLILAVAWFGTGGALFPVLAQQTPPPSLDAVLQRLQSNLVHYDNAVPSFFCDEHVVSSVEPGLRNQNAVTDSVFRLKRVLSPDHTSTFNESREIETVNGKPATSQHFGGPSVLSGAFEGGLAVVSLSQRACMRYTLQRVKRNGPPAPYVVRFASDLTPQNSANCLLQEKSAGQVTIDPSTMQITHLDLTTPHHTIVPGSNYDSPVVGERVISVDYAPVVLNGQTFWMPATIASTVTSGKGTYHAIVWSFRATYRNFHKLEVTSRILPADAAPVP